MTEGLEIVVQLTVIGPTGKRAQIETILDTGFTDHLALSKAQIDDLELAYADSTIGLLADGTEVPVDSYAGS